VLRAVGSDSGQIVEQAGRRRSEHDQGGRGVDEDATPDAGGNAALDRTDEAGEWVGAM
jgi:hypothetical protein